MGKLKDHFHDEICARANDEPYGPEPSQEEIEKFYADIELAKALEIVRAARRLGKEEVKHEPR